MDFGLRNLCGRITPPSERKWQFLDYDDATVERGDATIIVRTGVPACRERRGLHDSVCVAQWNSRSVLEWEFAVLQKERRNAQPAVEIGRIYSGPNSPSTKDSEVR